MAAEPELDEPAAAPVAAEARELPSEFMKESSDCPAGGADGKAGGARDGRAGCAGIAPMGCADVAAIGGAALAGAAVIEDDEPGVTRGAAAGAVIALCGIVLKPPADCAAAVCPVG